MAIAGGIALDLAFPGVGWWWLPPVAVAMLVIALDGRGIRWGAFVGFVFGAAFFVPHLAWSGIYVGKMPWLALATLETLYFAVLGAAATVALRCSRRSAMQAVAFGCLWVGQEAVRSRTPFGGFPWGRLAFSQSDAPSVGLAAIGGAPLVSFAVAVSGALLGQTILVVSRRGHLTASTVLGERAGAVVLLIAAAVVFSAGGLVPRPGAGDAAAGDRRVTVGAVQGNVPTAGLDFNAERRAVLRNHADATGRLAADVATSAMTRPDLVLWPENASDIDPLRDTAAADMISEAVDQVGVPVLVGTVLQEPAPKISNTSIVWNPGTGPGERYVKRRPVPFGEYIPYRSFFRKITAKVDLVKADFTAGRGPNVLKVGPATVGVGICFEVAFDDLLKDAVDNGADLLVIQTNNATFGRTDESVQQLAMSRLRAVEYGRSVIHISTVGVSALIGPDGAIQQKSGHFTQEILTGTLPLRTDRTIATRIGAWPEALLIAIGLISVAAGGLRIAARRR